MEEVLYAIEGKPEKLLPTLAAIARDFDEAPKELTCVLGPHLDGVQWFTFRASRFGPGQSLARDFFAESFTLAKRDLAVFSRRSEGRVS